MIHLPRRCALFLRFLLVTLLWTALPAHADNKVPPESLREPFKKALAGKKVAFLPLAMGFDLTEGWVSVLREGAARHGFTLIVKDPNWSTEAQAQALSALIADKPDVLLVQNPNVTLLAQLIRRAQQAGIPVVQVNMKSVAESDAYVGADWAEIGELTARRMVQDCGKSHGGSGKVAMIYGAATAAASVWQLDGANREFAKYPNDIQIVSSQSAGEWDASKAKTITETVLQQHPDLCGVYGFWDVMMKGAAETVKQSKRPVKIYTNGGGTNLACDGVRDGLFHYVLSYDALNQGRDLMSVIEILLQQKAPPGTFHFALYSPLLEITPQKLDPKVCWDPRTLKKS
jgi:ribose transport system substrate-binding protein